MIRENSRFKGESLIRVFFKRADQGFAAISGAEPGRVMVIDAGGVGVDLGGGGL
jgi:regulator of RNase E activity RraA